MQCSKLADKTALYQFNLNENRELSWSWNVLSKAYHITIKTLENFYVRFRLAFAFAPEEPSISTDVKKIRREKNIFRIRHTNRERLCVAICRCVYCLNGTTVDDGISSKNARQILTQLQEKNERIKNSNIYMPGVQMDCNRKLNKRMCDYKKICISA